MSNNAVGVDWRSHVGLGIEYYDDSTIVGGGWYWHDSTTILRQYSSNIWKLNIQSGKSEILFDSSKALFKSLFHGVASIRQTSVFKDLILCLDWLDYSARGYFIIGKNNFSRYFSIDSMLLQTKTVRILDCKFAANGTLLATAWYPDGIGLIISNDSGATWKQQGILIDGFKGSYQTSFPLLIGGAEGTFGVLEPVQSYMDSTDRQLARTSDMGNNWQKVATSYSQFQWGSIYGYFPSKISADSDTLFGKSYSHSNGDTSFLKFSRSVNSGKDWQTLLILPQKSPRDKDTMREWSLLYAQSVNNLYIGCTDGIYRSQNGGLTWTKYFMPSVRNIVDFKMIDNQRGVLTRGNFIISGPVISRTRNSDFYLFELGECIGDGFEYFSLFNPSNITFKGNAKTIGDYIRLTESKADQAGSMWYEKALDYNRSFEAKFGFQLTEGVNGEEDGTSPGADGVALVIAKNIPSNSGEYGGGIGYNGTGQAIAIEFDSFINKDRNDPDYDHVGVFASSTGIVNNHSSAFCLGTARINGQLKADISKHDVAVKYQKDKKILEVYLDGVAGDPLIRVKDFDLEKYLDGPIGYIGITSSTGSSMQNHFISDFSLCFSDEVGLGVEEPTQNAIEGEKAFPNPARETINIELPAGISSSAAEAIVFNQIGNEVSRQMVQIGTDSGTVSINVAGLPTGVYFIRIGSRVEKFMKM